MLNTMFKYYSLKNLYSVKLIEYCHVLMCVMHHSPASGLKTVLGGPQCLKLRFPGKVIGFKNTQGLNDWRTDGLFHQLHNQRELSTTQDEELYLTCQTGLVSAKSTSYNNHCGCYGCCNSKVQSNFHRKQRDSTHASITLVSMRSIVLLGHFINWWNLVNEESKMTWLKFQATTMKTLRVTFAVSWVKSNEAR